MKFFKKITGFTDEKHEADDDPPPSLSTVCPSKASPCVPAPRAHVETCARGAGTHGDVLNVHTRFSSVSHHTSHTTHHTHHKTQYTTHNKTPHTAHTRHNSQQHITTATTHNNTRRQSQRETEKEDREKTEETREKMKDKRQDERRGDKIKRREEKIKRDTMCCVCGCVVLTFPLFLNYQTLE